MRPLEALRSRLKVELILMIDHPAQIAMLQNSYSGKIWPIFIKIDCGTHRAGLDSQSARLKTLLQTTLDSDKVKIHGFYCHSGHSYGSTSLEDAEGHLLHEIECASAAAWLCLDLQPGLRLTISVGASFCRHCEADQGAPGRT